MKENNVDLDKAILIKNPENVDVRTFEILTDREKAESGGLPDDNVRVHVPLNISADSILSDVNQVYERLGLPDGYNDFYFFEEMRKIYRKLDIYDEVLKERYPEKVVHYHDGDRVVSYSENTIQVVKEMIRIMEENEGCGEMFPYDAIDALKDDYFLDE